MSFVLIPMASSCTSSDLKAVNAWIKAGSPSSGMANSTSSATLDGIDCQVIEHSTIPNQTGGPCFERYLPPLGPAYGLATLGFTELFVSTAILSHHVSLFAQISAWILFVIGCANFCLGYIGSRVKAQRQIFSFENLSTLTPQTSAAYGTYQVGRAYHHDLGSPSFADVKDKVVSAFGRKHRSVEMNEALENGGENKNKIKAKQERVYVDLESGRPNVLKVGKIPGVSFGGQAARREAGTSILICADSENGTDGPGWGGFGRKAEHKAKLNGYLISKPINTMPKP
ncbi:hypothetical protein [Phaffia rhodozyma]|uniref:Uncharacterized protein n=1 Tax=Phaffia rhodozyma TaxID=264483 RepID=A0A0F7SPD1_PHARH|nr:hypothetical protein [Phaffia rhodozyma]